ncbi:hypothetical protein K8I61_10595 [bacterium]|nr:hypothetical protein [bacterium]
MEISTHRRLGDMLVDRGALAPHQLEAALNDQRSFGGRIGSHLLRMGFVNENKLVDALAEQLRVVRINLRRSRIRIDALAYAKKDFCARHGLIPVARRAGGGRPKLLVAMTDPADLDAQRTIEFAGGCQVIAAIAPESDIRLAIDYCYADGKLREANGEEDFQQRINIDGAPEDSEDFIILSSDSEETPMRPAFEARLEALERLLIRKGLIAENELPPRNRKPTAH